MTFVIVEKRNLILECRQTYALLWSVSPLKVARRSVIHRADLAEVNQRNGFHIGRI